MNKKMTTPIEKQFKIILQENGYYITKKDPLWSVE